MKLPVLLETPFISSFIFKTLKNQSLEPPLQDKNIFVKF